jgi:hypothetical protein
MTTIRCQDTVFLTADFDDCVKELHSNRATFQSPLHVTIRPAGLRMGVPEIRLHDLVVEFDETCTTRVAVVAVLAKYGCRERPQGPDASLAGPVVAAASGNGSSPSRTTTKGGYCGGAPPQLGPRSGRPSICAVVSGSRITTRDT